MSRYSIVLVAAAAFVALAAAPAMADPPPTASCVGSGASDMAQAPPPGYTNFGQFTSSSVDANTDPGISDYVTFFAHLQPCPF